MTLRLLLPIVLLLAGWLPAAAQGLSPKAGTASDGLYTNLYFGMNYKLPAGWTVSFVAEDGSCPRDCVLLDARVPGEKSRRTISITAERLQASAGPGPVALAAMTLEQSGAKKVAPGKEITIAGRKAFRNDYSSKLLDTEVYYGIVVLPVKDYAVVFSLSSESRKYLDTMVEELAKAITFVGQS